MSNKHKTKRATVLRWWRDTLFRDFFQTNTCCTRDFTQAPFKEGLKQDSLSVCSSIMSVQQQFVRSEVTRKPHGTSDSFVWLKQGNKDNNVKNNSLFTTLGECKNSVLNTNPAHWRKVLVKDIKDIKVYFNNCSLTVFHNTPNSVQLCISTAKTNFTFERKCWNKKAFIPLALCCHPESCSHANIQGLLFLISTYMGITWCC